MDRPGFSRVFTLLDGGALVSGAAVASAHFRLHAGTPQGLTGWLGTAALFGWLAVTAAGPFVYLARRWLTATPPPFPQVGDWLWLLWGAPWVGTAVLAASLPATPASSNPARPDPAYVGTLALGLIAATAVAVPILIAWVAWVRPRAASHDDGHPVAWSQGVGLALTAAWPLQCGVGLVMMG